MRRSRDRNVASDLYQHAADLYQHAARDADKAITGECTSFVARMQGRKLAHNPEDIGVLGQPADQDLAGCGCALGTGRLLAGIPTP
jgi:hypothetical protein